MNSCSISYFDDIEFAKNLSTIYMNFHQIFFHDEYNSFQEICIHLYHLNYIVMFLTDFFKSFTINFVTKNLSEFFINKILDGKFFKFKNLLQNLSARGTIYHGDKVISLLKEYLFILMNILQLHSLVYKKLQKKCKIFFIEFYDFLKTQEFDYNDIESTYMANECNTLSIMCLTSNLWLLNSMNENEQMFVLDLDNHVKEFNSYYNILLWNLEICQCSEGMTLKNEELLKIFILLSGLSKNFRYLKKIFPFIFEYLKIEWKENIRNLAYQLIFCLISCDDKKDMLTEDENQLSKLLECYKENSTEMEHLRKIILNKLNNKKYENSVQIILNVHYTINNDIIENVIRIIEENINSSNILMINSNCKKNIFL